MSYFVISCQNEKDEITVSGMEAAFGIDKKNMNVSWADDDLELDAYPILLIIPLAALIVLLALTIPAVREKLEGINSPLKIISISGIIIVIGSIIGLIILAIANNIAIAEVKEQGEGYLSCRTGFGFNLSKFAFIVMLIMPFVDIFVIPYVNKILSKK
jgi:hypothetical protein